MNVKPHLQDHAHGHTNDHDHGGSSGHHGHMHHHAQDDVGTIFLIGMCLNILIVVLEAAAGFWGHSVSLLADAGHNLSDVLGLGLAWAANLLSQRAPTPRYTYGLRATSILAALFNAVFLLVVTGALSLAAIQRFFHPEPVGGMAMIVVAAIGIVANGATAMLLASRRKGDLNIRGAFMHMIADAAVSAGVVVTGILILLTGILWFDPLVSLAINAIIIIGTWDLLRESLKMSLGAVPSTIQSDEVSVYLKKLPDVSSVHDLHIWAMSTSETALTAHLVIPTGHPGDAFLCSVATELRANFGIGHATLQIETDEEACALAPETVI